MCPSIIPFFSVCYQMLRSVLPSRAKSASNLRKTSTHMQTRTTTAAKSRAKSQGRNFLIWFILFFFEKFYCHHQPAAHQQRSPRESHTRLSAVMNGGGGRKTSTEQKIYGYFGQKVFYAEQSWLVAIENWFGPEIVSNCKALYFWKAKIYGRKMSFQAEFFVQESLGESEILENFKINLSSTYVDQQFW